MSKITPAGTSTILATTGANSRGITVDSAGNIYTANSDSNDVSKITPAGTSTILATTGTYPAGITIDSAGNIYTANYFSDNVSKITPSGTSTILATTGTNPFGITVDSAGNIYTANYHSNDVSKITPPAAPAAAPTSLVATAGNASASIAFTPGADGGAAITNYEYSVDNGTTWTTRSPASVGSPVSISGLTNGTTYQIKLRAINSVGPGAASSAVSVTPAAPVPPPAPKPAKPAATWASSAKAKTITAVITPVAGVTYTLTAKSGRITKKGSCKNVTIKQGKKKLARRSCTVKLAKGRWLAAVTPKKGSVSGTVNSKKYSFK
ncbi:unannotated protein [freshwater metagenome]|uniref:Unannotated protein n=1 Tax=freshwater metagenome TaxID=449393 RepID=A0A6J5ZTB3_9ZZZZ